MRTKPLAVRAGFVPSAGLAGFALWAGLAGAGCGATDNTLSGSIGGTHDLSFDTVTVRLVATSYVIAYLKGAATATESTAARLSFTPAPSMPLSAGQPVTLSFGNTGNAGLSRASTDRLMFPAAEGGTLTFDSPPAAAAPGELLAGRFGLRFVSGQTLSGNFSAALGVAPR